MAIGSRDLTNQQRAAIQSQGTAVGLSAGAGCGKTFVLTERLLSRLAPQGGASLDQLIAITFTERAAREMRDRVRAEVHRRLLASAGVEAEYWLAQLRQLHTARISTIHSFCQSLLRLHAVEAGLDPQFRVLDQIEAGNLLATAIEDELQRQLADRVAETINLAVDFGIDLLRTMAIHLVSGRQQTYFQEWIGKSPAEVIAAWKECYQREVLPFVLNEFANSDCVASVLALLRQHIPSHPMLRQRRAALLDLLPNLPQSKNAAADADEIFNAARVDRTGPKCWPDPELYERVKGAFEELREQIDKLKQWLAWDDASAKPAAAAGLALLDFCVQARNRYRQRKQSVAALDFDDLLVHARDLLTRNRDLRRQIARRTALVLVDEFQDTDEVQAELVRALCDYDLKSDKLFVVGDAKQSIYRFRGADPQVFGKLRAEIPAAGRLPLTRNFRSQPAIIRFVNALFCDDLPDYEPLEPHRPQATPEPAVELLLAAAEEPKETAQSMRRREADWIARRLKQLLLAGEPVVCGKDEVPRPLQPGDIAILFRSLSDVEHYEFALRRHEIDYYLVGGHAFYSQQEVFDLVNLLRVIASHADDVSLVGALRSPFFSMDDDTLFWLAQHPGGLRAALFGSSLPKQLTAQQRSRAEFARETIVALRDLKDRLPISRLIQTALARTGYDALLVADFLGERKLANLRKLVDMARGLESSGLFTLPDFIAQLSDFVAKQPDEALAATQAETSNVVRLMTIHQAKGLEFPLVVIPDLERLVKSPLREGVAFDRALGPLVRIPKGVPGDNALCGFDLLCAKEIAEEAAETMRLFYVATTRAADYLLLSTSFRNIAKPNSAWMKLIARRFDLDSGQARTAPVPSSEIVRLRITRSEPELSTRGHRPARVDLLELVGKVQKDGTPTRPLAISPIPPSAMARRRYSFSALSGQLRQLDEEQSAFSPREAASAGGDALRLGTIVHAVLAELHPSQPLDVAARVAHHAQAFLEEDAGLLSDARELIERFLTSPRARKLRGARQMHQELEFLLSWPPGESASPSYLHGFIDCLYQDLDDSWHLIDYKTNRVTEGEVFQAVATYEMQMLVYALAVERVLGKPPESAVLYFLRPGCEHAICLDQASRRARTLVDQAIAAANAAANRPSPLAV